MTRAKIVGLTGGIGSGKSTVAKLFQSLGVDHVDADDIAREVVEPGEPCLSEIRAHFGADVLNEDGTLNRGKLRQLVFATPSERQWLENLTHPAIRERLQSRLNDMKGVYALLVHPLLFEKQQHTLCDTTIAISVPRILQIERATKRDNNSADQIERIMATQLDNNERCAKANFILENTGNSEELSVKVNELHKILMKQLA